MSGRVVWNHSTHVDGMIDVLEKLAKRAGVKTITPGRIRPVKGNGCSLRFRVSIPVNGGWKVNVRRGRMAQEVFVVTTWERGKLQETLDELAA